MAITEVRLIHGNIENSAWHIVDTENISAIIHWFPRGNLYIRNIGFEFYTNQGEKIAKTNIAVFVVANYGLKTH